MTQTSAPLLATLVSVCCQQLISEITHSRTDTLHSIVQSKVGTIKYAGKGYDEILHLLGPEESMIPDAIRVEEYERAKLILELAHEVSRDMPDMRMDVSVEDYQLIKRFYTKLTLAKRGAS